jgi:hypothetical protein
MPEHRMQHDEGPTWCRDCGRFDNYCRPGDECPTPGTGEYGTSTEAGRLVVLGYFLDTQEAKGSRA